MKPFLRLVAEDIADKFKEDLSNIAVVFNNKRPITYLKKHLSDVFGAPIWSPQFFTIQEFFGLSSKHQEASALSQFFCLYELHNTLLRAEGLEEESPETFYPIAETILSDFAQLDYDLVDIDQVYMELFDTTKIDIEFQHFTAEQQEFIRQFWQSFSIEGHTGVQKKFLRLWRKLPTLYKQFKTTLEKERKITIPTMYRNLAENTAADNEIVHRFEKVIFVGFNALNRAEATLFKKWQDEGKALFYFDTDPYYMDDPMQEAGLFLRKNLQQTGLINSLQTAEARIGTRKDSIHLFAATGKVSQTKLLHDILLQQETEDKTSAILLADESMLVPLLQSLPNIPSNITTGYPLLQSPLYGLIELWIDVHLHISDTRSNSLPYELLAKYISHPLAKVIATEKTQIEKSASKKQFSDVPLSEVKEIGFLHAEFFQPLSNPQALIPRLTALIDKLLQSIESNERLAQIDLNLLAETKRTLNQLHSGIEKIPDLSISFQIGLIKKVITPISSAIEGDPLKGIQIMGLLESRCLNFDNVYILGANEGILPSTSNSITFLPDNLRKAYGLPVLENQDALSAYLFYRHLQYSSGIHIGYNYTVDERSSGEVTRFVKQLEYESQFTVTAVHQQQSIRFTPGPEEVIIQKENEVWQAMLQKFLREGKRISATAITTYLQSPLLFFLKYVAEIKEPPRISQEFEMNSLGTVIHNVMEKILLPYKSGEDFVETSVLKSVFPQISTLVTDEIGAQYFFRPESVDDLNSLQHIMHRIACTYVKIYLEYDIAHYQAFRIIELENNEDYQIHFPITVEGKEEKITLYGIIDRVDEVVTKDGQLIRRIVDYKTGGDQVVSGSMSKVLSRDTENKAMVQTLYYTYIFEQVSGMTNLEPHLYVARRMREDGTLFRLNKKEPLEGNFLEETKHNFVDFLRTTLEEIFDPSVPFRHSPKMKAYESDPYQLFYIKQDSEQEE